MNFPFVLDSIFSDMESLIQPKRSKMAKNTVIICPHSDDNRPILVDKKNMDHKFMDEEK
jgi:hypothetical protein